MTTVTDRTYTFTGLRPTTSYDFEVLAINEQGIAPDNHAAELTTSTASGGIYMQLRTGISCLVCIHLGTLQVYAMYMHALPPCIIPAVSIAVPNPPILQVVLPRFSSTFLVWRNPEPFVGYIVGVEIRYLIDCVPQDIPDQGGGVNQYSVSGIKGSEGKTHSISLRARTSAGWGSYSTPVEFVFRPIGEAAE